MMCIRLFIRVSFSFVLLFWVAAAQARIITYNNDPSAKEQYIIGLLKLAIEKNADPNLQLKPAPDVMTDAKFQSEVEAGNVSVYWAPAVNSNVEKFIPVHIPLVKGLLGYRLFIIKQGDQYKYDGITDLSSLKRLTAGQGTSWGDTQILAHAGIPLETSIKYENLFYMLEGERFDYFPRGAHEPWSEIRTHADLNLTIEKSLILVYPLAMYFYINKSDQALASAIENGLEKAIADGSFDAYFFSQDVIKSTLKEANMKQRRIIPIDNPFLPKGARLDRPELWLDVARIP